MKKTNYLIEDDLYRHQEDFTKLPSQYQIKDLVSVDFGDVQIPNCRVFKVHFTESKVLYDLEIMLGESKHVTRIYNIDSYFVKKT